MVAASRRFIAPAIAILLAIPAALASQSRPIESATARHQDLQKSESGGQQKPDSTLHSTPPHYWRNLGLGFATSIIAHEAGHVGMSLALGAHPTFGFDGGRPTIYSGIDATLERHKQFLFAQAGLDVQAVLDEAILDVPHHRGSAFERGLLAGGVATAYFYATIGRNASNSDITYMARTSSLSRTQASLIYAGLASLDVIRMSRDKHYASFFVRPSSSGPANGLEIGVSIRPIPEDHGDAHTAPSDVRATSFSPN